MIPGVYGSPADAVLVGLGTIMKDRKVDLVISGPNFGQNLGTNVFLSGTVGGAMTAVLQESLQALSVGINLMSRGHSRIVFPVRLLL